MLSIQGVAIRLSLFFYDKIPVIRYMSMIRLSPLETTHTWKTVYREYDTSSGAANNVSVQLYNPDSKITNVVQPQSITLANGIATIIFRAFVQEGLTYRLTLEQSLPNKIRISRVLALCTSQSDLANYTPFDGQTIDAPDGDNTFITIP